MYHPIVFGEEILVDLEFGHTDRLERMVIHKGSRMKAQLRPYVVETETGLIEVADLFFEDGTTARLVPFEYFAFEEPEEE